MYRMGIHAYLFISAISQQEVALSGKVIKKQAVHQILVTQNFE